MSRKPFYRSTLFQLVAAIVLGVGVGLVIQARNPAHETNTLIDVLKMFSTLFIHLVKMIVGLVIFCTLSTAIARMGDGKEMGRIGVQAIIFFEVVSTAALLFGQWMGNVFQPGAGAQFHGAMQTMSAPVAAVKELSPVEFILNIVPTTVLGALTQDNLLQVLLVSILFGFALLGLRERAEPVLELIESLTEAVFAVVGMIMKLAPLAVFGAMSATIAQFGFDALAPIGKLVGMLYLGCGVFVAVGFGAIAWYSGFNLWSFIKYIRDEIVLVYGTASSEAALPRLIAKLERAGCSPSVVGLVVPAGYSFNLVGSSLYLTLAALFIAQATHHPLSMATQWALLGFFLLTSKGMAGVTAASFVVLASALSAFNISDAWLPLILAVDRIMDAMRSVTNLIGNGVSALVIAKWVGERDDQRMLQAFSAGAEGELPPPQPHPLSAASTPKPSFGTVESPAFLD